MGCTKSRRVAIHEAGHVAVDLLLGNKPHAATIEKKKGSLGWVARRDWDDMTEEGVRDRIVSLYAGAEAERRVHYNESRIRARGAADDELADEYLPFCDTTEYDLRMIAADLVRAHWPLVERMAVELMEHGTLARAELESIYNIYLGRETERDLAECRERAA